MTELKVYDECWVMLNNKIEKRIIYSVIECMNLKKTGVDRSYTVMSELCGAIEGRDIPLHDADVYKNRQSLIDSL